MWHKHNDMNILCCLFITLYFLCVKVLQLLRTLASQHAERMTWPSHGLCLKGGLTAMWWTSPTKNWISSAAIYPQTTQQTLLDYILGDCFISQWLLRLETSVRRLYGIQPPPVSSSPCTVVVVMILFSDLVHLDIRSDQLCYLSVWVLLKS